MINKPLDKIELSDLENLIQNAVSEGKTIDYKVSFPGNSDIEKKEFLADVSSFATTSGGDLIFGIREENGVAKEIKGISVSNTDEEIRKYENLIRDGLEPRIQSAIRPIKIDNTKNVFIIRINKSWNGPHRVIFKGHDKFYARNSAGKYPMDTMELRTAFNLSDTLVDKIKKFMLERVSAIIADNTYTPMPLCEGGKIILHLIPLESFSPNVKFDIQQFVDTPSRLPQIYMGISNYKINLEGIITYTSSPHKKIQSYTQLYRNGIIESVDGYLLSKHSEKLYIPSIAYEKALLQTLPIYLNTLKELNVSLPIFIFLTLTGIKNYEMAIDTCLLPDEPYKIDRDILWLPESLIETYEIEPQEVLRPLFDLIWNACGLKKSFNFDDNGKWTKK